MKKHILRNWSKVRLSTKTNITMICFAKEESEFRAVVIDFRATATYLVSIFIFRGISYCAEGFFWGVQGEGAHGSPLGQTLLRGMVLVTMLRYSSMRLV